MKLEIKNTNGINFYIDYILLENIQYLECVKLYFSR